LKFTVSYQKIYLFESAPEKSVYFELFMQAVKLTVKI